MLDPVDNSHRYHGGAEFVKPEEINYEKIEKNVVLPDEIPIEEKDSTFIHNPEIFHKFHKFDNPELDLPDKIEKNAKQLKKDLEDSFKIWDHSKDFKFQFIDSKFEELLEGQVNSLNYATKFDTEEEDTFKPKLSAEQLKQIAQKGQFEVKSNNELIALPYVWKVNEILFRGTEINHRNWLKGLAAIYDMFSTAFKMVR